MVREFEELRWVRQIYGLQDKELYGVAKEVGKEYSLIDDGKKQRRNYYHG
jgi:hypothetical protein